MLDLKNYITILMLLLGLFIMSGCQSQKRLKQNLGEAIASYNTGSISYDEAYAEIMDAYTDANNEEKQSYVDEQLELLERLKTSKENYEAANSAFEKSDYGSAMEYYDLVIEEDDNYESAETQIKTSQEKYIETVDAQAQIYLDDEKYQKAIAIYEDAQKVYDDGNTDGKISDIEEIYREDLETKAETSVVDRDWKSAITTYETLYDYFEDETYTVAITNAKNECINDAIAEAEDFLSQGNYTDAKSVIASAQNTVGIDDELDTELARIESYVPVSLRDLNTFYADDRLYNWSENDKDNLGNTYTTGIYNDVEGFVVSRSYVASYLLDGEYDILEGKFVLHWETKNYTNGKINNAQLKIYGDDKLLYESGLMYGGVQPEDISVDISGVNELKIEFASYGSHIQVGFVDPMLSKTYTPLD